MASLFHFTTIAFLKSFFSFSLSPSASLRSLFRRQWRTSLPRWTGETTKEAPRRLLRESREALLSPSPSSSPSTSSSDLPPPVLPGVAATLSYPPGELETPLATVHLVGVAHVSRASAEDAARAILETRPDAVVLELDPERFRRAALGLAPFLSSSSGSSSPSASPSSSAATAEETAARKRYGIPRPAVQAPYAQDGPERRRARRA